MYTLFRRPPVRLGGSVTFPELAFLRRSYQRIVTDVQEHYRRYPKRVDSDSIIGNLLLHIPRRWDLSDREYLHFAEDVSKGIERAMNLTTSTHRGKVHHKGGTLGDGNDEVILSVSQPVLREYQDIPWYQWETYRYLYHTRYDPQLPILHNQNMGKAWGVGALDIPRLALQYRKWLVSQSLRKNDEVGNQKETVYRFIGKIVYPNAVASTADISFFNRLSRKAAGIPLQRFNSPHPFYITDYSRRLDELCDKIIDTQERRSGDLEQVVYYTPMLMKENLWEVMALPKDPVTRHNEWAMCLARLPYIKYVVDTAVKQHTGDRRFLNELHQQLIDAREDSIFSGIGSPQVVEHYRTQLSQLLDQLHQLGHGWK